MLTWFRNSTADAADAVAYPSGRIWRVVGMQDNERFIGLAKVRGAIGLMVWLVVLAVAVARGANIPQLSVGVTEILLIVTPFLAILIWIPILALLALNGPRPDTSRLLLKPLARVFLAIGIEVVGTLMIFAAMDLGNKYDNNTLGLIPGLLGIVYIASSFWVFAVASRVMVAVSIYYCCAADGHLWLAPLAAATTSWLNVGLGFRVRDLSSYVVEGARLGESIGMAVSLGGAITVTALALYEMVHYHRSYGISWSCGASSDWPYLPSPRALPR